MGTNRNEKPQIWGGNLSFYVKTPVIKPIYKFKIGRKAAKFYCSNSKVKPSNVLKRYRSGNGMGNKIFEL